jgi:hypothetical protein
MGICPKPRLFWPEVQPLEQSPIRLPYIGTTTTPMNEPVSLNDCVRYPNSPLCPGGGKYFDPCGVIPGPIPDDIQRKCNECECCSYITYRFLGFPTPPTIVCERKNTPECKKNIPKNPFPDPLDSPIPEPDLPPLPPEPRPGASCFEWEIWVNEREAHSTKSAIRDVNRMIVRGRNEGLWPMGTYKVSLIPRSAVWGYIRQPTSDSPSPGSPCILFPWWAKNDVITTMLIFDDPDSSPREGWVSIPKYRYQCGHSSPRIFTDPPYPPYDDEDDMSCCEETNDKLDEILKRIGEATTDVPGELIGEIIGKDGKPEPAPDASLNSLTEINEFFHKLIASSLGTGQFPAKVPAALFTNDKGEDDPELLEIKSLTALAGWFIGQFDALIGQFPIRIEIEDSDATKEGDQKKEVILPNLAEAIAELYGLSFQSTANSALIVDLVLRNISEAIKNGNMGVETLDYAKAVAKHLGFKGNKVERKIPYFVDPRETQDLDKYRKEVELSTQGFEYEDKQTMAEQMKMVLFAVSIIKAAFWEEWNPKRKYEAGKGIRKDAEGDDTAWNEHLAAMRNPESPLRQDDDPPIKIREIPKPKKPL